MGLIVGENTHCKFLKNTAHEKIFGRDTLVIQNKMLPEYRNGDYDKLDMQHG
jgi:hypothetical protein